MVKRLKPYDPFIARMQAERQAEWEARLAGKTANEKIRESGWKKLAGGVKFFWEGLPSFVLSLSSLLGAAFLLWICVLLALAIWKPMAVIAPITLPKELTDRGYTPEVVAEQLSQALAKLENDAKYSKIGAAVLDKMKSDEANRKNTGLDKANRTEIGSTTDLSTVLRDFHSKGFAPQASLPNVVIPNTGLPIETLAASIRDFFNLKTRKTMSGVITRSEKNILLHLHMDEIDVDAKLDDLEHLDKLLKRGTEQFVAEAAGPVWLALALADRDQSRSLEILERFVDDGSGANQHQDVENAYFLRGVILYKQDKLFESLQSYQASLAIKERLTKSNAGNAKEQRDLSVFYDRVGDSLVSRGKLSDALQSYQASLVIAERLVQSDEGNFEAQRDLLVPNQRIGDVLLKQDKPREALQSYQRALDIAERLAKLDASNATWQRDLSLSNQRIGDVLLKQDKPREALQSYQKALYIAERLAQPDEGNSEAQRDLLVSNQRIGDVLLKQDKPREALQSYQKALDIAERLAKLDASNATWQRDLLVSNQKIGDVLLKQDKPREALQSYQKALDIAERLAQPDEGNSEAQRDLSLSNQRIGDVLLKQDKPREALQSYQKALDIAERLAKSNADNAEWRRDLSVSYSKLGDTFTKQGKHKQALEYYHRGLATMERLAATDPSNLLWQDDIVEYNYDLAINGEEPDRRFAFVAAQWNKRKTEHELTAEQTEWLAKSEAKLKKTVRK